MQAMKSPNRQRRSLWRDSRGVAAVEFSLVAILLTAAAINVADIGVYTYERMELENAAQMGAAAASKACDYTKLPAVTKCSGLTAAITAAIQSTSLGADVTLSSGYPQEGYYCLNSSNDLQYMSDTSSKPANCSAAGMPLLQPADYIKVQVSFAYAPIFNGFSVAGMFTTPVLKSALLRLS
jgi:Flp pilus assembly protein TadG